MTAAKATIVALALVAGLMCVEAAGGIKGRQEGFRAQSVKGPAAQKPIVQQQYLPPPPPPQPLAPPPALPTPTFSQQAIKGQSFAPARAQPAPAPFQQRVQQVQEQVQEQEPEPVQQQQQQEEIDPNAAAQEGSAAFLAPARAGAASEEEANPRPEPYSFQYAFNAGDQSTSGSSQREETQDANGRVTGFYTLKGEDGRDRRVEYVADASGFHATINTNELGTANKDSADATWSAQEPSEAQLRAAESATQEAQQRALLSPAQQQHQHQAQHQQQQQQQSYLALGSSSSSSFERASASASGAGPQKFSSPRQKVGPAAQSRANNQQQFQLQTQQLQEPFEQIRQSELSSRARKSRRHAPFYLFNV